MKVAIIQQHNTASRDDNRRRLAEKIASAAKSDARLVVLQELHDGLYFCQTENVAVCDQARELPDVFYAGLAEKHGVVLVTSAFERRAPGLYHNTAVVYDADGREAGRYRKMHIPDDPAYYEKFYFAPGDIGFEPIPTTVGRLGVLVCWDQWFPEAARLMALAGAEILVYPTAIGWDAADGDEEKRRQRQAWQLVQRGHAVANGLPLVAVNRVGREANPENPSDGIDFWGTSFACGPQGEMLYEAPSDAEDEAVVDIDMGRCETVRRWWPFLRDRRIDAYGDLLKRFAY